MSKKPRLLSVRWDGRQITKPGIYSALPLDQYHRHDICDGASISSSGLRTIYNESAAHFYDGWDGNPDRNPKAEDVTKSMILGRALHHVVAGEDFFTKLFVRQPDTYPADATYPSTQGAPKKWTYNAQWCQDWRDDAADRGLTILSGEQLAQLDGMGRTLSRHPMVVHGALRGAVERSIFWRDKETGIWLKARPDVIPLDSEDAVDLKTTDSVVWKDLMRTIFDYGYHQQGALVVDALKAVVGFQHPTFSLFFIESKRPHCPRPVQLKPHILKLGADMNRVALRTFERCLKTKRWPGPGGDQEDFAPIEFSKYHTTLIERRLEHEIASDDEISEYTDE